MHPLIKIFTYCKKYNSDIFIATFYSLLNKLFDILPELLIGVAVDIVVNRKDSILASFGIKNVILQIVVLGIITGLIWCFESLSQYLCSLKWCFLAQNIQHDLRLDTYHHTQNLELEYFDNKAIGNVMAILNDDINQLERFFNDNLDQIIQITASTILIAIIFFVLSPKIALLSFIPIPLILILSFSLRKLLAPRYKEVRDSAGTLNAKLNNNFMGIATIKSFTTELYELNKVEKLSNEYKNTNRKAIILSSAITPIVRLAIMSGFLTSLIYGGILTLENKIPVASYSILIFMSQRFLWPFNSLAQIIDSYQRAMSSVNRVMGLLNTPIKIQGGLQTLPTPVKGKINFKEISFGYPNRGNIFNKLSLEIKPGEKIAFVGSTGSGKSTIVKLLLRFYELNGGSILIDDIDIKELTLTSLRYNIGLVSQETFLIDGSIEDNIRYGSFDATFEQVKLAAKVAEADIFIERLPQGYDTLVGERGQKLSGGQRQRIAIARTILKNPAILVLDEATSALDNKTETLIQKALDKVSQNRTTIMIAHRLSTIINCDKIYVLRRGYIAEYGTHQELINYNGIYANLWRLQLKNDIS